MEENQKKQKLVMFDGNAILHRAYHAYPQTLMTVSGELTNAVYGFTATLLNVFKKLKPSHVVVAFDEKQKTFRHKKFKEYKAQRPKMDEELVSQIDRTREVVRAFNIPIYAKGGYEADDLIGTIARKAEKDFEEVVVVTGDKDILQIITEKTHIYFPSRGRIPARFFDKKRFVDRYQFEPIKLIDFKGLSGDKSDNIPGIMGVGEKTATKLLISYGSVEGVYENVNDLKGSLREKVEKDRENAFLSKELATIKLDCPVSFEKAKAELCEYNKSGVIELFESLEFKSLIRRLPSDKWEDEAEEILKNKKEEKKKEKQAENQMSLF